MSSLWSNVHEERMPRLGAFIYADNNKGVIIKENEVVKSKQHQILNGKMPLYINLTDDSICGSNMQEHEFFWDFKHFFMQDLPESVFFFTCLRMTHKGSQGSEHNYKASSREQLQKQKQQQQQQQQQRGYYEEERCCKN
jgi:hypothetical protein